MVQLHQLQVIHFKNGMAEKIEKNENPKPIEEIEW